MPNLTDDDWIGLAVANDARGNDDFRARLVASKLVPDGYVVVRTMLTLNSPHVQSASLKPPFATVFLFDAGGHPDPLAAFKEAKATGNVNLSTINIGLTAQDVLGLFGEFTVELFVRGYDLDAEGHPETGQLF